MMVSVITFANVAAAWSLMIMVVALSPFKSIVTLSFRKNTEPDSQITSLWVRSAMSLEKGSS